jgi:hypothetical protein
MLHSRLSTLDDDVFVLPFVKRIPCFKILQQVDTGKELKRVTWKMMRNIVASTIEDIEGVLDELRLPGKVSGMALL